MKPFHAPPVLDEVVRQIIEQFRIGRLVAGLAEVADRRDDALAEIFVPDTVHINARCERIGRAGEPVRQRETATGRRFRRLDIRLFAAERLGERRLHFVELALMIAAEEYVGRRRVGVAEFGRARERNRTLVRPEIVRLSQLRRELAIFFRLLEIFGIVILRFLVFARIAEIARQSVVVGDDREAMIDPAVESVPVVRRLEDRFAAVGQIALLVIGQRRLAHTVDELFLLGLDVLDRLFPLGLLRLEALLFIALHGDGSLFVDGRVGEERLQRKIVLLGELVVFVVVAARACDRGSENRRAQCVHDVGGDLIFALHQIA